MNQNADNVIILGAGASFDAGVPLMSNFIDTMWNIARTGRCCGEQISENDRTVLEEALGVREDLDGYHGRASFDMWNIEDLLSILSFNALAGGRKEKNRFEAVTKGIAKVIEVTCRVKHSGQLDNDPKEGRVPIYENFWAGLIDHAQETGKPIPPIVTFNYDLVLERSLLRVLTGSAHFGNRNKPFPWKHLCIRYAAEPLSEVRFDIKFSEWGSWSRDAGSPSITRGPRLYESSDEAISTSPTETIEVKIFKLHGSVNFPRPKRGRLEKSTGVQKLVSSLDDPLILPPVFNKATNSLGGTAWAEALRSIRACKNLIVCGYSLPATDIYMQYFLKSALGPNQDLNRIFVFDPVTFNLEQEAVAKSLMLRYSSNFSEAIQHRISFSPPRPPEKKGGTFNHLVSLIRRHPSDILFG